MSAWIGFPYVGTQLSFCNVCRPNHGCLILNSSMVTSSTYDRRVRDSLVEHDSMFLGST